MGRIQGVDSVTSGFLSKDVLVLEISNQSPSPSLTPCSFRNRKIDKFLSPSTSSPTSTERLKGALSRVFTHQ